MSDLPLNAGARPFPTVQEVISCMHTLQSALGAYVQFDARNDEGGKATASARVIGAYRKLIQTYEVLPEEAQLNMRAPIHALHETVVSIGIPLGACRVPLPVAEPLPELEAE
ncbi:hypothetical protein J7643_01255 [bacterium]|nr:hypothetical protein [bacterium]